jgi:hypothetical protein
MQITFEALEQALAPIEKLGQGEITFPVSGTTVTLCMLTPEQEVDVQRYASEALKDGNSDPSNTADYLERFKIAILSHAIVAVGDQDLRTVTMVETEETLPSGMKIKLPKVQALRKVLLKWTGSIRLSVFRKYGELVERVERSAEKAIQFEPADLEAEIERVSKRLSDLKDAQEKQLKQVDEGISTPVSRMAKAMVQQDKEARTETAEYLDQASNARAGLVAEEVTEEEEQVAPVRHSVIPTVAVPPSAPVAPLPVQPQQRKAPAPVLEESDSFVDSADMEEAIKAENRRLLVSRQRGVVEQPPAPMRKPPHLAAREATDFSAEEVAALAAQHMGPDGVPVLPSQESGEIVQKRMAPPNSTVPLNRVEGAGNPRFRSPQR